MKNEPALPNNELTPLNIADQTRREPQSIKKIIALSLKNGFTVTLAFTFSGMIIVLPYVLSRVPPGESGNYTKEEINAAINAITPYLSGAATILVAEYATLFLASPLLGAAARDNVKIARVFRNGITLGSALALPTFFTLYFSDPILQALGTNSVVADLAGKFLSPYAWIQFPVVLRLACENILNADGAFKIPLLMSWLGCSSAIVSTIARLYLGQRDWGVVAEGFLIDAAVSATSMLAYLLGHPKYRQIPFLKSFFNWQGSGEGILAYSKLGGIILLQNLASLVTSFLSMVVFPGMLGPSAGAALNFATQFTFITAILNYAFGNALPALIGKSQGTKDYVAASQYARWGLVTVLGVVALPCVAAISFPRQLIQWMSPGINEATLDNAKLLLRIAAVGELIRAATYLMIQIVRQAGDNNIPTFIFSSFLVLGALLAWGLGVEQKWGIIAVLAFATGVLAPAALWIGTRWWKETASDHLQQTDEQQQPLLIEGNAPETGVGNEEESSRCGYLTGSVSNCWATIFGRSERRDYAELPDQTGQYQHGSTLAV